MPERRFCPECGGAQQRRELAGEQRNHWYCQRCRVADYDYPAIVVNVFAAHHKRLLWVQRNIEPRRGLWAIPGGFLEKGETLAQGAVRELREEAGVVIPPEQLQFYMTGTVTFINQVYMAFRVSVDTDNCQPGTESMDCRFYSRDECPWDSVGYPEINRSIVQAYEDLDRGEFHIWQSELSARGYSRARVRDRL